MPTEGGEGRGHIVAAACLQLVHTILLDIIIRFDLLLDLLWSIANYPTTPIAISSMLWIFPQW